jgi:signal transduction histidine kinase
MPLRSFARFLLENHLEEFAKDQIRRARESDIPLMKLFVNYSPDQLYNYVLSAIKDYLKGIADNSIIEDTKKRSQRWKKGELPEIGKADVLMIDLILTNKIRKEGLMSYLKKFTSSIDEYEKILFELEDLYANLLQISFGVFFEVQQELILKEKNLTEKVLDSSLNSIVALESIRDKENKIVDFKYVLLNSVAESMMGPKENFLGKRVLEKFPSMIQEGIFEKYVNTTETGVSFDIVFYYDHEGFNHCLRQIGVKWDDGLVITTEDITAIKKTEQEIRKLNKNLEEKISERTKELRQKNKELLKINEDLDNFVYTASHDLKAPVSNLEGLLAALSEIITEDGSTIEEKKTLLAMMEKSVIRFKNTIQDLTDITKTQKQFDIVTEEVNLQELWENVVEVNEGIIKETNAKIEKDFSACSTIRFSKANLYSIFYNLLSNAIKYRHPSRNPEVKIVCKRDSEYTMIAVSDNGLGIAKNNLDKIFSMFKRFHSHVEGSGIGLYIVKRIIENAGGEIKVDSEVGKGTVFNITFKNSDLR